MTPLARRIAEQIAVNGPITVAELFRSALLDPEHGYYATHNPFANRGDFITSPEISQMFGELMGAFAVQTWLDMGSPAAFTLAEVGPGRGILMMDALRAAMVRPAFLAAARVVLVEASPVLRAEQAERLTARAPARGLAWTDRIEELPDEPLILIGNEFLDCLPIRQFVRTPDGWREKVVGLDADGALVFGIGPKAPALPFPPDPEGSVREIMPDLADLTAHLARRFAARPGRALFIDYGSDDGSAGDTLQAMAAHRSADILSTLGESDLTAHVDFRHLATLAGLHGLSVAGPVTQGAFLRELGIEARAGALAAGRPLHKAVQQRALDRLCGDAQMGRLFKVLALSSPGLPPPPGL
jgi:NADH dehydrogenase [ubiquinone] 1 alpha subcomplex assembly factor 7